jgi:hypothetical protein
MFPKVLPVLMTMMLLANQAIAVVSHSHGESSDPTARPHVHLHCDCYSHGHHHHHHGHSHHHEQKPDSDNETIAHSEAASHDIDVIYVGEEVSAFAQKTPTTSWDLSVVGEPALVLCDSPVPARTKHIARSDLSPRFAHARMLKTVRLLV